MYEEALQLHDILTVPISESRLEMACLKLKTLARHRFGIHVTHNRGSNGTDATIPFYCGVLMVNLS